MALGRRGTFGRRVTRFHRAFPPQVKECGRLIVRMGKELMEETKRRQALKAEVRARLYGSIGAGIEEEHQKILSRRLIIERRKEEQARREKFEEEMEEA